MLLQDTEDQVRVIPYVLHHLTLIDMAAFVRFICDSHDHVTHSTACSPFNCNHFSSNHHCFALNSLCPSTP